MKLQATVLAGLLAAGLTVPAVAQEQQAPPPVTQSHGDRMMHRFDNLNLSDAQRSQIQTLMQNYRQAHPKGSAPDPDARKALRQQIEAVLTPDQRAQLKSEFRHHRQPPAPQATPNP